MPNLPKSTWAILAILTAVGTLADGASSGLVLMAMLGAKNILSQILVFAGGLMITGMAVSTKAIFSDKGSCVLKIIWLVATVIDLYTTIVGTIFYVIMQMPLSYKVDFSLMYFDPKNFFPTLLAFGISGLITGSSIVVLYVVERLFD